MRTLLATVTAAIGLGLMAAQTAQATPLPAVPMAAITHSTDGVEQVHWRRHHRHHHRHWGYSPRYYGYGYGYPRYRSYGYYGGGYPGFSLYIGPRHRWHRW